MNISLPSKWLWKLEKEEGLWQELIKYKILEKWHNSQCKTQTE